MADKLMIVMVNTDPRDGPELGAPFFQATVAAAMDYDVEVILTGRAGELAIKGVAENSTSGKAVPKPSTTLSRMPTRPASSSGCVPRPSTCGATI
jgi:predicted peroxiredoxin